MFQRALDVVLKDGKHPSLTLKLEPLAAGYGAHVFNEIARRIIGADIAVFDTSERNPNVMIEMGVALTWGIRILPIREETTADLPSDISGQTWAKYRNNGSEWIDPNHETLLVNMLRYVVRKKKLPQGRPNR
jgi:hypothetical protein